MVNKRVGNRKYNRQKMIRIEGEIKAVVRESEATGIKDIQPCGGGQK